MGKSVIKLLFLVLSISLFVGGPLSSAFSNDHGHAQHKHHRHHLDKVHVHNVSWHLISTRQLSSPPLVVKSDVTQVLLLGAILLFLMPAFLKVRAHHTFHYRRLSNPRPIYLLVSTMLI
ncbi:hypothetical protein MUY27_18955 [Mucilaginibacter sp. RS28]|uniref:Uncharacterized protein n=1 Tax=Mucilaginibacter straminoryzae TaxID=2932774 RepID=A0A9X1X745_9SPHI|nr:hypothetical protein [Mucilaginibacter straminoryzae]MCJ8211806.1 hypothetical protein [Mucilaginibacter straminoryzae]